MSNIFSVTISLDGICMGVKTSDRKLKEYIIKSFPNSISDKEPDVVINAEIKDFKAPLKKNVLIKARGRELGIEDGRRYVLYRDNSAIAWIHGDLKKIDILIKDAKDSIFLERMMYFILMGSFSKRKMSCLHASGAEVNKRGFLFIGPSGAGKSTIVDLAARYAGGMIVDGDAILLQDKGREANIYFNRYIYWGREKPDMKGDISTARVSGIFFLSHGKENAAIRLSQKESVTRLMGFTMLTLLTRDEIGELIAMYADLVRRVPCFDLRFLPDRTVWDYLTTEVDIK